MKVRLRCSNPVIGFVIEFHRGNSKRNRRGQDLKLRKFIGKTAGSPIKKRRSVRPSAASLARAWILSPVRVPHSRGAGTPFAHRWNRTRAARLGLCAHPHHSEHGVHTGTWSHLAHQSEAAAPGRPAPAELPGSAPPAGLARRPWPQRARSQPPPAACKVVGCL